MTDTTSPPPPEHGWHAVPRSLSKLLEHTSPSNTKPVTIADVPIPSTPLSTTIQSYAQSHLSAETFNHSMRVYHYGLAIAQHHLGPEFAPIMETYFLTCMLHDIGTTPENLRKTRMSFEFFGGLTVLDVLQREGAPRSQAESVAEAVIRHQDLGETGMISAVGALVIVATVFDNVGMNPELVHEDTIGAVTEKYPRNGWSGCFAKVIEEEIGLKPWCHTTHIDGFKEKVLGNKLMEPYE